MPEAKIGRHFSKDNAAFLLFSTDQLDYVNSCAFI